MVWTVPIAIVAVVIAYALGRRSAIRETDRAIDVARVANENTKRATDRCYDLETDLRYVGDRIYMPFGRLVEKLERLHTDRHPCTRGDGSFCYELAEAQQALGRQVAWPTPSTEFPRHSDPERFLSKLAEWRRQSPEYTASAEQTALKSDPPASLRCGRALSMHPALDVIAVREALARWEVHLAQRAPGFWPTSSAWSALFHKFERLGSQRFVDAIEYSIAKSTKSIVEDPLRGVDAAIPKAEK